MPSVHAATLFSDRFESGNFSAWTGTCKDACCNMSVESASARASVTVSTTGSSLKDYRFAWANGTDTMTDSTWYVFSSNPQTISITLKLNTTVGSIIKYEWYFNDSDGYWGDTGVQSFTTTARALPPLWFLLYTGGGGWCGTRFWHPPIPV
jgi:hypothetical protein